MVRASIVIAFCAVLLAGCDNGGYVAKDYRGPGAPPPFVPPPEINPSVDAPAAGVVAEPAQQFSFSHVWNLRMARAAVSPRFTRARDLCLRDRALSCRLVSANLQNDPDSATTAASLTVLLPHARLDGFERALLAPVKGEKPGDAKMASRSSQAVSVETAVSDTARTVARLTAYRDRLAEIAKRTNMTVEDIIKLEAERARVQTELDDATNRQRDLTDGIARESVTIFLSPRYEPVAPVGPLTQAVRDAGDTLTQNAAAALRFTIGALPWLPIVAAGIFLLQWLWRLFRRRRQAIVAPG